MNKKILVILLVLCAALFGLVAAIFMSEHDVNRTDTERVSGLLSDTYTYKHITSANASSTKGVIIRGGAGNLNIITIGSSSPAVVLGLRIYDGNATSSTDLTATSSGTLIGVLKPSSAEGTYWFNTAVRKGVVIDVPPGYNGSITVMTQ